MARWTSMTMEEFRQRFRRGRELGRVSWAVTIAGFAQLMCFVCAIRVVTHMLTHRLNQIEALAMVELTIGSLIVLTFALAAMLHGNNGSRMLANYARSSAVAAAIVLLVCYPHL